MQFDIAMPFALFAITMAAMFLNKRVEGKLKKTFEEREFRNRDSFLFAAMVTLMVSVVIFVPEMAILTLFMFSYFSLLFTFSYIFSGMSKRRAQLFCLIFGVAGLAAGTVAVLSPVADSVMFYGGWALCGLGAFALFAMVYERTRATTRERLYLAVLPPALFTIVFFVFNSTPVWFPFLFNVFGIVFAILITLYLASLFTWKTTVIFAAVLTVIDFILVLVIPVMEAAATHVAGLGLPVVIVLPIVPPIATSGGLFGLQPIALGLGDFFFAGTLATQTYKKFGKRAAVISAVTMSAAFGVFEILLLSTDFGAFPGTLMIIFGWVPIVAWKLLAEKRNKKLR